MVAVTRMLSGLCQAELAFTFFCVLVYQLNTTVELVYGILVSCIGLPPFSKQHILHINMLIFPSMCVMITGMGGSVFSG